MEKLFSAPYLTNQNLIMLRSLFLSVFFLISYNSIAGIGRAPWSNLEDQKRWSYDSTQGPFSGLLRSDHFDFFPTNSGFSGEIWNRHYVIQYGDQKSIDENNVITINLGHYGSVKDLDYRVWKNGTILFDAKKDDVVESTKGYGFTVPRKMGEVGDVQVYVKGLEPGTVLELFWQVEGVELPLYFKMNDFVSLKESKLSIKAIGERSIYYTCSPWVKAEEIKELNYVKYSFIAQNTGRSLRSSGLPVETGMDPFVTLDWRNISDYLNSTEENDWYSYLPRIFFKGDLNDFAQFENLHNEVFGHRIYLSSSNIVFRDYGHNGLFDRLFAMFRSLTFASNQRSLMKVITALDLEVEKLSLNDSIGVVDGVMQLNNLINDFVIEQMKYSYARPIDFIHYSLLSKYYYQYLEARAAPVYPVLLKTKRRGNFMESFVSTQQFDAMAMGFKDENGRFHFTMLGPYLGSFYNVDFYPSDFSGGQAVVFDETRKSHTVVRLPYNQVSRDGFVLHKKIKLNYDSQLYEEKWNLQFKGCMSNRMFHGYLIGDTAVDGLSNSEYVRRRNGSMNRSSHSFVPKIKSWRESKTINIDLEETLVFKSALHPEAEIISLPFPYFSEVHYIISADRPINVELDSIGKQWEGIGEVSSEVQNNSTEEVSIILRVTLQEHFFGPRKVGALRELKQYVLQERKMQIKEI